ncbi:MAG TPA: hypothetical protein VEY51_17785 [Chondromyces sp.]|nr:hypothetical protein [Chondromyces sp.]
MSQNKEKKVEHTSGAMEQPLMSTGTVEPGFDWDKDKSKNKLAAVPKIGETLMGEDGITGQIR